MLWLYLGFLLLTSPQIKVLIYEGKELPLTLPKEILSGTSPFVFHCSHEKITATDACGNQHTWASPLWLQAKDTPITFKEKAYGYLLRMKATSRGCQLVQKLPLEAYLQGVIPGEMSPDLYPSLETLKAQAVAARTYAFYHLEHPLSKDYHICATPACQVYQGQGVHQPLSDQAVKETEGLILTYQGKVIPTYYTASCGGHSAPSRLLNASYPYPYQPCFPLETFSLKSHQQGHLSQRILKEVPLGFLPPSERLASWKTLSSKEKVEMLETMGWLKKEKGFLSKQEGNYLWLWGQKDPFCFQEDTLLIWEDKAYPELVFHRGERVILYHRDHQLLALVKTQETQDPAACQGAKHFRWKQFLSWEALEDKLKLQRPFKFEPLQTSPEGRLIALRIHGKNGKKVLKGLEIRFTLGLPEIQFSYFPTPLGIWFFGKGWGHGVGLCQEGAFGMGVAGYEMVDILHYYYPAFSLRHW